MSELEGSTLGRYQLLHRLGRGGMSEVYLAYDERMNRDVAIKVVAANHTGYLERFQREAEAIGRLNHDHILPAFDYGDEGPWHYLVMPYIAHKTLRERLRHGPLSLEDAGEMLLQIADALQFAHDNGILHRDIKPSNILLRDDHHAYLADFGLAKSIDDTGRLTGTGALIGTPEYMAPDLAEGPATTSSDIYALGILLYQMISGHVPFSAEEPITVYWKQVHEQPLPPSVFNPAIPRAVDTVVLKALEKKSHHRFQTALALAEAYLYALQTPFVAKSLSRPVTEERVSYVQQTYQEPVRRSRFRKVSSSATPNLEKRNRKRAAAQQQSERLILSDRPVVAHPTTPSFFRRRARVTPVAMTLPPLPMRQEHEEASEIHALLHPSSPAAHARRSHAEPTGKNMSIAVSIIALGLLFFIVLPMSYIYYVYSTSHPSTTTTITQAASANRQQAAAKATADAQAQAQARASATAAVPSRAVSGTPLLTDSLASNQANRWAVDGTHCLFTDGAYHAVVTQTDFLQVCTLQGLSWSNMTIQVDATLITGNDVDVLLRANSDSFYDFGITNQGHFFFRRHDHPGGNYYDYLIPDTASSAIGTGLQKNTLLVIANGSTFKLFINGVFVGEANDSTYSSGQLLLASGAVSPQTAGEGSFANLRIFPPS